MRCAVERLLAERPAWRARYIVLTYAAGQTDCAQAWASYSQSLNNLLTRMRTEYGPVQYFRTVEAHMSGYPHVNLLVLGEKFLTRAVLEDWWRKTGGGGIHIKRGEPDTALYMSKDLANLPPDLVKKRWTASGELSKVRRTIESELKTPQGELRWELRPGSLESAIKEFTLDGYVLEPRSNGFLALSRRQ